MENSTKFWKSEKPLLILTLILFLVFIGASVYAHTLETKYNDVVIKFNNCSKLLNTPYTENTFLPQTSPGRNYINFSLGET